MASVFSAPSMASMRPSVTTTACPTSNGAERAHHVEAARDVDHLVRLGLHGAERTLADEQRGQHLDQARRP